MGLKNPKSEVCKAIHDRLVTALTYNSVAIPIYVDIAPKDLSGADTYVLIWGYIDNEAGNKIDYGFLASVNVEINTNSDDSVKHNAVVNSLKELMHTKKADHLIMANFNNSVLKEPSMQYFVELAESGQIFRTILKYELNVEQK